MSGPVNPACLRDYLTSLNACNEAVEWASEYATLQEAWDACERADWMLWLVRRIDGSITLRLRLAMCACARTALKCVPAGEDRPRIAIETAERYARGEATEAELITAERAASAAYAAYAAASASAAASAADAAAYAAYAAASASAAASAAYAAASAAAYAAARSEALRDMAALVREIIPTVEVPCLTP